MTPDAPTIAKPRRRLPTILAFFAVVALVTVVIMSDDSTDVAPTCSPADPCTAAPEGYLFVGLVLVAPIVMAIDRGLAALIAAGLVLGWQVAAATFEGAPLAATVAVWCFGALYVVMALPRRTRTEDVWTSPIQVTPPHPARLRYLGRGTLVLGLLLLLAAAAITTDVLTRQVEMDRRQAAARIAVGEVQGVIDDSAIAVAVDGRSLRVNVLSPGEYPVGAPVRVFVDDAGLAQLVAEPYDAYGYLIFAVVLGSIGLALVLRVAARNRARRRLFNTPQPYRTAMVIEGPNTVVVPVRGLGRDDTTLTIPIQRDETVPPPPGGYLKSAAVYGPLGVGEWLCVVVESGPLAPVRPSKLTR